MSWLSNWAYRIKITIDSSKIDTANLTDFPIMIHLSSSSGISSADVTAYFDELASDANRKKIAITSSDGTTQLYCEIELHDDANEEAWLHVKVPSISYTADTILYLYYDSAQADNTTYIGDTTDAVTHNVWDSNFVAVYHMAQDPNGDGADAIKDSTANANDGTPAGTMLTADLVSTKAGDGIDFDGSDDIVNLGNDSSLDLTTDLTIEVLAYSVDWRTEDWARIVSKGSPELYSIYIDKSAPTTYAIGYLNCEDWEFWAGIGELVDENWHYIALAYDGSETDYWTCNNGVEAERDVDDPNDVKTNSGDLYLARSGAGAYNFFGPGIIDEIRISTTPRTASWLKATYNSLWDSLITFGAEESHVFVEATTATLTITPQAARIIGATTVWANTATLSITANAATLNVGTLVEATAVSLTIAAQSADVKYDPNVLCAAASLTITPHAATISYDIPISPTSQALTITPYDAVVWDGAAWNAWLSLNYEKVIRKYTFTLTGEDDGEEDIDIPFSSFQCRRRDGEPTYLSVVIKDTDYSSAIAARSNGDMKITMSYIVNGESIYKDVISIVDLENIQLDKGGSNQSISLTGHRTTSYTPKSIELRDVTYYQLKDGKYVYRCAAPDLYLAPGDTATYGDVSFIVDQVQYTVSVLSQMMQVKEA